MNPTAIFLALAAAGFAATITLWIAQTRDKATNAQRNLLAATHAQQRSELEINEGEEALRGWFGYWNEIYKAAGKTYPNPKTPGIIAATIIVISLGVGVFILPGPPLGFFVPVLTFVGIKYVLAVAAKRRLNLIDKQLPLLISSLRANLRSGATPQQALLNVADEIPEPLGLELQALRRSVHVAVSLDDALHQLAERVPSRELAFLAASIEIAVRSGADLNPQLAVIDDIIIQRTRLQTKLASAIAATQPTKYAVLGGTAFFALLSLSNEEYRDFWFSPIGLVVAGFATMFTIAGLTGIKILIGRVENA